MWCSCGKHHHNNRKKCFFLFFLRQSLNCEKQDKCITLLFNWRSIKLQLVLLCLGLVRFAIIFFEILQFTLDCNQISECCFYNFNDWWKFILNLYPFLSKQIFNLTKCVIKYLDEILICFLVCGGIYYTQNPLRYGLFKINLHNYEKCWAIKTKLN